MKRILLFILYSLIIETINGQIINIKNETNCSFDKIIIYTERSEGRHIYEYNLELKCNNRNYTSPVIHPDTLVFKSKIKLLKTGKYTFKFAGSGDSIGYAFGIDVKAENLISINKSTVVFGVKNKYPIKNSDGSVTYNTDPASDYGVLLKNRFNNVDLCFNFVNNTNYTIYAIYPWISDEKFQRGTILFHDPDRRLLPNEQRMILVSEDRSEESYNIQKLSFKIAAIDSESKLIFFKIKDIDINTEDIIIDEKSIKFE